MGCSRLDELQVPGSVSEKTSAPRKAVRMKLVLVLITLTRTVLLASVSARVNRPHMMALKARFMRKKNCAECKQIEAHHVQLHPG